jgi:outer membrane receptor protein involved in Fe transport
MWGQSPYSINAGLFFQHPDWGTSLNLAYNISGKRIVQVAQVGVYQIPEDRREEGPHVYELPRDVVDLSISQQISNLEIKFAARDLLNQVLRWEQLGQTVATNLRGRGYALSVAYKFN